MNKELLIHAKEYIEKMANGINPLTNELIPQNELINNVKISRCLFYVNDVLSKIIQKESRGKKIPFFLNEEKLNNFEYSDRAISMSEIVKKINDLINKDEMKSLTVLKVQDWLVSINVLNEEIIQDKKFKRPTTIGTELGISTEVRTNSQGISYKINLYNKKAQEFIIDNFENLLEFIYTNKK